MILCDIGNSSFHFFNPSSASSWKVFDASKLPLLSTPIYFISVNDTKTQIFCKHYPTAINLAPYIDFPNGYTTMGIDRQFALLMKENGVVVDAGSAITVDIIENKIFQGGFILAGLNSLQNCYKTISSKLAVDFNSNTNLATLPKNTQDAINYGILQSVLLPIISVSQHKTIYLTGGDAEVLAKHLPNAICDPHLIFKSMIYVVENMKTQQ